MMKSMAKAVIVSLLGWQVRRLTKRHTFRTVGVAGSVGKTSTKFAVARVLGEGLRVRFQEGNYNDIVSVPLIFFGHDMPSLLNPIAWSRILINNERQIRQAYPYDVVVVEIGTDGPGQIVKFKKYLKLDTLVLTSLLPEHMEYFGTLDAVADEELSAAEYSDAVVYNTDLCPAHYLDRLSSKISYGIKSESDYIAKNIKHQNTKLAADIYKHGELLVAIDYEAIAEPQLYSALAAAAVADRLKLMPSLIQQGLAQLRPVSGRMQTLRGIRGSMIIDDTYNASPDAVIASLAALYKLASPQRIAILGSMNELGESSKQAHIDVGKLCDPTNLNLLVTIGKDANQYLAEAATQNGCRVKSFDSPYEAGLFVKDEVHEGAIILAKGSQNGVFAEEAVKPLLADPTDTAKLVRQSSRWMRVKQQQFGTAKAETR